ncbi:hypothetical protein [Chitinophaga pinensis]|uniref:Uncharacterized protein n=1 Tax=Chitinophaga pinensis (strain ATCC 43595 / DSM 2588 / LMG 13176 / NBRC 15968 / NCIMB 11800 / UQM 2034) TaxID=485918 RepID=A0A979GX48_CHIPD|nr:hypothetical protein [Chitinophaga pinensis]ACU64428.1 hypothetical protein Cpin_7027 [Chitinophaga pinensis DSM 2588]
MNTPDIPKELLFTDEEMKAMSHDEIMDRVGKIVATGKLFFPGMKESGEEFARHLEQTWKPDWLEHSKD